MNAIAPEPRRRRFRFSLRALLVAVTIACTGLGWISRGEQRRSAVAALRKSNPAAVMLYGFQVGADGNPVSQAKPNWITRWRNALGVDYFSTVVRVDLFYATEADLKRMAQLRGLKWLQLDRGIDVTDQGLEHLRGLGDLKMLWLAQADRASDRGLECVAELTSLERLSLDVGPHVTADGLKQLSRLPHLRHLDLASSSPQTAAAIGDLRRLLPLCRIDYWRIGRGENE